MKNSFDSEKLPTWCPGCGNFTVQAALKTALSELDIKPSQTFISFDIGCNGNGADVINAYAFKGLHGRSIPLAIGAHLANRKYTVIADIGDGGCLHEGLDHLLHAIRSNYDITILIHNNQNFALTTGQATATTQKNKPVFGFPEGKPEGNINIGQLCLSLDTSFFARGYSADPQQLTEIIKKGIKHKGCSVIETLQICPTYNPQSSPQWYNERIKKVETTNDIHKARKLVEITDKHIFTGVIYQNSKLPTFYDSLSNRKNRKTELVDEVKEYNIKI